MVFNWLKTTTYILVLSLFIGCTTDDVSPSLIEFSSQENSFSESDGSIILTATLNGAAANDVTLELLFTGTAVQGTDYTLSANQLSISSGSTSGSITISPIQDTFIEGVETLEIMTGAVSNVNRVSDFTLSIILLDDDSDTDSDGVLDAVDDCVDVAGDPANNGCPFLGFIINEVNYDPASGSAGDANADGTRDANDDEFVEFYNSGPSLDISGYLVFDTEALLSNTPRHVFPAGTIVPMNSAVILFGGGTPTGNFGGALIQTASGGAINLNNSGDFLTVQDASGTTILTFDVEPLSDNPNESYTRDPDLTGNFVQHASVTAANGVLFSPGVQIDGTSF